MGSVCTRELGSGSDDLEPDVLRIGDPDPKAKSLDPGIQAACCAA